MKDLLRFFFSQETRAYARWRWRQSAFSFVQVPFEWIVLIWKRLSHRRTCRHSEFSEPKPPDRKGLERIHPFLLFPNPTLTAQEHLTHQADAVSALVRSAQSITLGTIPLLGGVEFHWTPGDWQLKPEDPEILYALHRWAFALVLGKAWLYTRETRYIEHFHLLLSDWDQTHPATEGSLAWESYNVSERLAHACAAVALFWDAPTFQETCLPFLAALLARHARWLRAHLETSTSHNHLLNNARALYLYGSLFNDDECRTQGWAILVREFDRQIGRDGLLSEQSIPYHILLTRTAYEVYLVTTRQGKSTSALEPTFLAMLRAAAVFLRPDHSLPLIGDVSPDIPLKDLLGVLRSSYLHLRLPLPFAWPEDDFGSWYLATPNPSEVRAALPEESPHVSQLREGGFQIYRTSQTHFTFHNDPRSEIIRHGHADALSITLWAQGFEILLDSGNSTYATGTWKDYFRGARSHNGVTLDGLPPYPSVDHLSDFYVAPYRKSRSFLKDPVAMGKSWIFEGSHSGYERLGEPIQVRRRVVINDDFLWVTDWVDGGRKARPVESAWHWNASQCRQIKTGVWILEPDSAIQRQAAWWQNGTPVTPEWIQGQAVPIIQGWVSPDYGQKKASLTSLVKGTLSPSHRLDLWVGLHSSITLEEFIPDIQRKAVIQTSRGREEYPC